MKRNYKYLIRKHKYGWGVYRSDDERRRLVHSYAGQGSKAKSELWAAMKNMEKR